MSEPTPPSDNPYASGPLDAAIVDRPPARPVGTLIVAAFLLLGAALLLVQRGYWFLQVYSPGGRVRLDRAFYVVFAREAVTFATAILGGVGLLIGARWGWWAAVAQGYWRLLTQTILVMLRALLPAYAAGIALGLAGTVGDAVASGIMFALMVFYLQKKNVVAYVRVAPARRLTANLAVLAGCCSLVAGLFVWRAMMR